MVHTSISDINMLSTMFYLVGGLGIFLYGIELMGDSLKSLAGEKLKEIIKKFTSTPFKGIIVGFLVTVIIQSSSATTALTIGLVRSGLMTFVQAVGIIFGANIGTTATAFLIGLNIEGLALPIMGIGGLLFFFSKKSKIKDLGKVLFGFGMLFYGLNLMGSGMKPLANTVEAYSLFETISKNSFLGLIVGAIFTAIIQSSSAAIGILQTLYPLGVIPIRGALSILLGSNIGTTITAIFASAGGSAEAKRTTVVHVLFNVIGAILFTLLLDVFYVPVANFIQDVILQASDGARPSMTIALSHTFFNTFMALIMFPFINKLVALAKRIVPGETKNKDVVELEEKNLIKESSTIAISFAKDRIIDMAKLTQEMLLNSKDYLFTDNNKLFEESIKQEDKIDAFEHLIHNYLYELTGNELSYKDNDRVNRYIPTINDLERIGDLCTNIFEFANHNHKNNKDYSENAQKDLNKIYKHLILMMEYAIVAFQNSDPEMAEKVLNREEKVDNIYEKARMRHLKRLNKKTCSCYENYIDILNNLERIGDHLNNICEKIIIVDFYSSIINTNLDD